jgi:hypothetical protein
VANLSASSWIASVFARSLLIAASIAGCATHEIQAYPRNWPLLADAQQRCSIEGDYVNVGVIEPASMGVSTDGSALRLNALLRSRDSGPIGPLAAERVRIAVDGSTLTVTVPGEPSATFLSMRGDLGLCIAEGGFQLEFSRPYSGESGAGILHITRSLSLADDGSLVVKSTLFFDASRSFITRLHTHEDVMWQRFTRVVTSSDTLSTPRAPAR